MSTDKTLEKFEEKMLKEVSPLELQSIALLEKSTSIKVVKDDTTLGSAIAIKKEINAHVKFVKESRMALTRPLDDMKKTILSKESEIMLPLEKAKADISDKILTYEEELERLRALEEERLDRILDSISVAVWTYTTASEVDARGKEIKVAFSKLSETDQNNIDIKLKFRESVDALTTRKTNLEEEERQKLERERLAKEAEKQSAERAQLEKQRAEIDRQEREIQAEKERKMRELERQEIERQAEEKRKEEARAEKSRPKSNIATMTEFEVVTPTLVDRIYCSPDPVKIRQAIKDGVTEISGVRIFQTKKVR
jgi:hypothetical protein